MITYFSLASGFLTGKYRTQDDLANSPRGGMVSPYLVERGTRILKALDTVAAAHGTQPGEVALAWLMAREGVTAPIASATSAAQAESFACAAGLTLSQDDMTLLTQAGE